MKKKRIHLVCNAHIDPVWLWEWEEGAGVAISTFRTAADLCEEFDGFVFNHNEAILYQWVERYEPALFRRIQRLVRRKKWHIMGGWYLQPDCNMPSGESFVRQILTGKQYFKEKFKVRITTAINFDPFGHTRGLVQILAKSGYDSYLFCRPGFEDKRIPAPEFVWVGYDGSKVMGTLAVLHYESPLGKARSKVEKWMKACGDREASILLWGVGDHGGGPSRKDLKDLAALIRRNEDFEILHSTPEAYFKDLGRRRAKLPLHQGDINPWAVGCYTSIIRIKQKHRQLENELYMTEKMASTAAFQGLMKYPQEELHQARLDLLANEFHDVLPGSCIQPVEEAALRGMDHGLELLSRVKAGAFYALASGQKKAAPGEIPILVYNPHPFPIAGVVECELQLEQSSPPGVFILPAVHANGKPLPTQVEKEASNINIDWRKKVAFLAVLEPGRMNRFDCRLETLRKRPEPRLKERNGAVRFKTRDLDVVINGSTGLMDRFRVKGADYVKKGAFKPLVMKDNQDPWGMTVKSFRKAAGCFKLMPRKEGSLRSGVEGAVIPSVRVIEDGPVRSVVEAVLAYGHSCIHQQYKLPKEGTEIEVEVRVLWNEKDRILKLSIPTKMKDADFIGQVAYGRAKLDNDGNEMVVQKWLGVVSRSKKKALTCINDGIYGSDMHDGELRLSLLRSPAYSGHPIQGKLRLDQDRHIPRIDQGERIFRFWLNAGQAAGRLDAIDREALAKNERPFALSFFPSGHGKKPKPGVLLSDRAAQVAALKKSEKGGDLIIRLFEPTGRKRTTKVTLPFLRAGKKVTLTPYEVKTLRLKPRARRFMEVNLLEEP